MVDQGQWHRALLSALEFTGKLDNRIATWALTNTSSLGVNADGAGVMVFPLTGSDYYPSGNVWVAAEYIPGTFGYPQFLANGGTYVASVTP